jgi:hypothetical protein
VTSSNTHHTTGRAIRGTLLAGAVAAAFIGATPGSASADTSPGTTDAHVAVQPGITLTGLTSSFTLTGTPGQTVATDPGDVVFNVETNNVAGYTVTVQSEAPNMVPAIVSNADVIAIGDLTVRNSEGAFQALSADDAVLVHTQPGRSANGGDALGSDYQIRIPVVNADVYSATLDYVATTL